LKRESPGDDTSRVTEILNGHRAITGDTALRLAHFFGTSPEFWLNLQSLYEIRLAERKSANQSRPCRPSDASNSREPRVEEPAFRPASSGTPVICHPERRLALRQPESRDLHFVAITKRRV